VGQVRTISPKLAKGVATFGDHPLVGNVRSLGLLAGVELVADRASKTPFEKSRRVGPYLVERAQQHGVILRAMGDTVVFAPPLIIREHEIEEMLAGFGRALDDVYALVRREGLLAGREVSL